MKSLLLTLLLVTMTASVAKADIVSVYSDAAGIACTLNVGFTSSATVLHKFTAGATGSRFKILLPPGSTFFAFNTEYATNSGSPVSDIEVRYGECLTGSFLVGTIVANLAVGYLMIVPPDNFTHANFIDCSGTNYPASGGSAGVGLYDCYPPLATERSTWGAVKSLYR